VIVDYRLSRSLQTQLFDTDCGAEDVVTLQRALFTLEVFIDAFGQPSPLSFTFLPVSRSSYVSYLGERILDL
jgi:hypothetical protein